MRIAVIGAGRMGAMRAQDLAADPRVGEVLVANRDDARGREVAERLGVTHLPWSAAARTDANATVVAVTTDAHAAALAPALRRGRPVLCEKPIAATLEETEQVIHEAVAAGVELQIGFQRRFDPGFRRMHERIAAGQVGELYSLSLLSHDIAPSPREFIGGSGGIFRDLHVHDFDLIRWLTGEEVAQVFATSAVRAHHQYAEFDDADVTTIHAVTAGGVQVVVRGARHDARGHDVRVEAHGSLDSLTAGLTRRTPLATLDDDTLGIDIDPYSGFIDRFREAFRRETAAFVDLVTGKTANPCPPDSALESLRIAIACERSVALNAPVLVADVHATAR